MIYSNRPSGLRGVRTKLASASFFIVFISVFDEIL